MKSGLLTGGLPFVRLGDGDGTLVIFPGLADAVWDVTSSSFDVPSHYGSFAREFTVYLISRKRGLPPGYTTRDMAVDYAHAITNDIGPAHVMGISLGGYVAQQLAAEFPKLVCKLVLASTGYQVSEAGREIPQRWLALAKANRWREFYFDVAKVIIREYHHTFYQFLLPLLRRKQPDPADFLVSLEASLSYDGSEVVGRIQAPTLVIGGHEDRIFPEALLRETAKRIPHATLHLLDGTGHGAYEEHKSLFEDAVVKFIRCNEKSMLDSAPLLR